MTKAAALTNTNNDTDYNANANNCTDNINSTNAFIDAASDVASHDNDNANNSSNSMTTTAEVQFGQTKKGAKKCK